MKTVTTVELEMITEKGDAITLFPHSVFGSKRTAERHLKKSGFHKERSYWSMDVHGGVIYAHLRDDVQLNKLNLGDDIKGKQS